MFRLRHAAPEECDFYRRRYRSAGTGNYDIYVTFTERTLAELAENGLLGFIMPHKFWKAQYGHGLRSILGNGRHVREIIDFGHQQVFREVTTYTAIHILSADANRGGVDYARFDTLTDGDAQCRELDRGNCPEGVVWFTAKYPDSDGPWQFASVKEADALAVLSGPGTVPLQELADRMYQGVRTSMNEVFVLCASAGGRYRSEALGRDVELEAGLLKPFLRGEDICRYAIRPPQMALLFPYKAGLGSPVQLIPPEQFVKDFPLGWSYLRDVKGACETGRTGKWTTQTGTPMVETKILTFLASPAF